LQEEPLGLIALRNCQLVQTSLAKLRQAIGGGDKSYLEFQIVNPSAEPLFVGAQPALGLPTVRGKVPFSHFITLLIYIYPNYENHIIIYL
jgi:hypothetical protein